MELNDKVLRRKLLEGMIWGCENTYDSCLINQVFPCIEGFIPKPFQANNNDKFIFLKIIDKILDEVKEYISTCKKWDNKDFYDLGTRILLESYHPQFGEFKYFSELTREEAIENWIKGRQEYKMNYK